jgi:hypothetical protein
MRYKVWLLREDGTPSPTQSPRQSDWHATDHTGPGHSVGLFYGARL